MVKCGCPIQLDSPENSGKLFCQTVEIKNCSDPDWETWRDSQKCIGGSSLAAILGLSTYESPRAALQRCSGLKEKAKPNAMAERAMAHGRKYESYAKAIIKYKADVVPQETRSYIYRLSDKFGNNLNVCVSPDMESTDHIWEIKCPYFGKDNASSSAEFQSVWMDKNNPLGKPAYFVQAAFYAWLRKKCSFSVVVCFVFDDEQLSLTEYSYEMTEELEHYFCETFLALMTVRIGKYRVSALDRQKTESFLSNHLTLLTIYNHWTLSISNELEEQTEDDADSSGPPPPGE